ncbi:MAG: site-specific DNA-methyltransferase [Bacteroidales bacterium]|nr:site-specific DNA-methyltransferase [Bacteroidales bacterium]
MPEIFDEGKIDWEKLKATLGEEVNFANERYVLNWAGKSDAFRIMQQPSSATLVPCREESVDFDQTENLFIEGENMEVLKVLQKSYFGKVKMIYIDPPYNTGNDSFIYPDKFSETKEEYLKRVGDKDEEGYMTREGLFRKNSKENGQYHSNWLNMMMPRLYLAKSLLREDGVIFVSIDDNEVHNLRLLMNEIFGEENFVASIVWQKRTSPDARYNLGAAHDYVLVFGKDLDSLKPTLNKVALTSERINEYKNPDDDPRGPWASVDITGQTGHATSSQFYMIKTPSGIEYEPPVGRCWALAKQTFEDLCNDNRIWFGADGNSRPRKKIFLSEVEGVNSWTWWANTEVGHNQEASKEIKDLLGSADIFTNPKPTRLLKQMLTIATKKEDVVLDFFSGSATTAHAVMQLNKEDGGHRKYICVQLPELCDPKSEAYKAGYSTIAEISKERIRRAGAKIRAEVEVEQAKRKGQFEFEEDQAIEMPDLGFKVFKLSESNFKQWREIKGSNQEEWKQQMLDFLNPVAANATTDNMVYELLLKSGKSLNSTIEHKNGYHAVNGKELILMLEAATQEEVDAILAEHPQKVLALDNLFEGNDQLKTNAALQMRDAGVEFRTI